MGANVEFLNEIPLFQTMDDEERAAVAALTEEASFAAGEMLFREREIGGICYILRSGRVELSVKDEPGQKLVLDVLEKGELCGELGLFDGGTRSATGIALEDTETLALERPAFLDFLRRKPDAALDVLAALAKRIRRADMMLKHRMQNPNELIETEETLGNRIADTVAAFGGSWRFISIFLAGILIWILFNLVSGRHFDPYPFILLNLGLSLVAALQAPVIMMSQNRQDAKDRIRSEADYNVNVRAEVEISELHEKLESLSAELRLLLRKEQTPFLDNIGHE
jgi:CRP/FNR family cyclic AMP-dependent transcriptional regulator